MRPWISLLLLGAGLTAAIAAPATAGMTAPQSPVQVAHNGHIHAPFHRHRFFHSHPSFGPFVFGAPLVFPGGYYGSDIGPGTPPVVVLSEPPTAAAPPPPLPELDQRPSVETTAEGVVIVRGPGSHHLGY
jgi:hypothetical protein